MAWRSAGVPRVAVLLLAVGAATLLAGLYTANDCTADAGCSLSLLQHKAATRRLSSFSASTIQEPAAAAEEPVVVASERRRPSAVGTDADLPVPHDDEEPAAPPSGSEAEPEVSPFVQALVHAQVQKLVEEEGYSAAGNGSKEELVRRGMKEVEVSIKAGGEDGANLRRGLEAMAMQSFADAALGASASRPLAEASQSVPRDPGTAGIHGLYTFGAPGTSNPPLENARSADGIFPGVRVVMRRKGSFLGMSIWFYDPVAFACNIVGLWHAKMAMLVVGDPDQERRAPRLWEASDRRVTRQPPVDLGLWISGHLMNFYYGGIEPYVAPYNKDADAMAWFSMHIYGHELGPHPNLADLASGAEQRGWNLAVVASSKRDVDYDQRTFSYLFQEKSTLRCAMVFRGSDSDIDWLNNIRVEKAPFCGFPYVHQGFADHLRSIGEAVDWQQKMLPALPNCKEVVVTGHSLGGAAAEMFAACVQRAPPEGYSGRADYQNFRWTAGTPAALPAVAV